MTVPVICDVCGGEWIHINWAEAVHLAGDHDPVKVDPATVDYIRDVLGGVR